MILRRLQDKTSDKTIFEIKQIVICTTPNKHLTQIQILTIDIDTDNRHTNRNNFKAYQFLETVECHTKTV